MKSYRKEGDSLKRKNTQTRLKTKCLSIQSRKVPRQVQKPIHSERKQRPEKGDSVMNNNETLNQGLAVVQLDTESEKRAQRLYSDSIVVDTCHAAEWDEDYLVNRLAPSGINVVVRTIASRQGGYAETGPEMARWFSVMENCKEYLVKALCYNDIEKAVAEGKVAVIFAFQGSKPLDRKLELLDVYYQMGLRVLQLTYNNRDYAGDGCLESHDAGLSDWGKKLVERMNKLGAIVDLSHGSPKTTADAIEVSSDPVIHSHSNCKALVNNPRNVEDDLVKKLGETGGYIGINVWLSMLTDNFNCDPTLDDVLDHVDHAAKIGGPHCVGFGLDRAEGLTLEQYQAIGFPTGQGGAYPTYERAFDTGLVKEIRGVGQFINLARALVKKGYIDTEITGILGGNFLRVFKRVVG